VQSLLLRESCAQQCSLGIPLLGHTPDSGVQALLSVSLHIPDSENLACAQYLQARSGASASALSAQLGYIAVVGQQQLWVSKHRQPSKLLCAPLLLSVPVSSQPGADGRYVPAQLLEDYDLVEQFASTPEMPGLPAPGRRPKHAALRVTTSVAPGSGGCALDLELNWAPSQAGSSALRAKSIVQILLFLPAALGEIESCSEDFQALTGPSGERVLQFAELSISAEEQSEQRKIISLVFAASLHAWQMPGAENRLAQAKELTGTVWTLFDGSITGVEDLRVLSASGVPDYDVPITIETQVQVQFRLGIAGLEWHQQVVAPTLREFVTMEALRSTNANQAARGLMEALGTGRYVHSIADNLPCPIERADQQQLFWDLYLRQYVNWLPVDVHLQIQSVRPAPFSAKPASVVDELQVSVSVQGDASNARMCAEIQNVAEQLSDVVVRLGQPKVSAPPQPVSAPTATHLPPGELPTLQPRILSSHVGREISPGGAK
jgi:hypothetical protein